VFKRFTDEICGELKLKLYESLPEFTGELEWPVSTSSILITNSSSVDI
jgi:hypothetical protein